MPHGQRPNHRALYTGSFDPVTLGHLDVVRRGRLIFDDLIVAIGRNLRKREMFPLMTRQRLVQELVDDLVRHEPEGGRVQVATYEGLTVDFARHMECHVILRGIRNLTDLAYEVQLAMTNREVAGIETLFIMTSQNFAYTSSNLIKQIAALGGNLDQLKSIVPANVLTALKDLQSRNQLHHLIEDQVD